MSRLSGAFLVVAGVGMAAYAMHWTVDTEATARRAPPANGAPTVEPAQHKEPAPVQVQTTLEPAPILPASKDAAPALSSPPAATPPKLATKTIAIQLPTVAPKAIPVRSAASTTGPVDRARLTKELLVQLKRVGCYQGPIGGVWTAGARSSMKAFTEHVNATLPVDQPDYILLAMVQSHEGAACGRECPAGEARNQAGRCLPAGIVAAGSKKRTTNEPRVVAKPAPVVEKQASGGGSQPSLTPGMLFEPQPVPPARMSLAGPKQETADGPAAPAVGSGPGKQEARQLKQPGQRRYTTRTAEPRRPRASVARSPSWVPWAPPWAMN